MGTKVVQATRQCQGWAQVVHDDASKGRVDVVEGTRVQEFGGKRVVRAIKFGGGSGMQH